ncbi:MULTISPECIES: LysE family translocator [Sphingomonadales]|uniref:LysE family translocator n=2 Tax=Edaphosphingomonas TaxID=3423724 RepID=A0A2T4HW07_9SPHN|nr:MULTISPECIES: LysE family translocator [Sphingomonas]AGH48712.1 threonine efflux protein [Sphingomonas sp. MM-1]OHT21201.1 Leucine efflux protein [Sphingomonas haloaromaticamans]PTD19940.1 LysE family translocator [Sphingomonas fennica]
MLTTHTLLAWTVLAIALVLTPGPDTMLVAGNAARRGFRAGIATASGIALGGVWYMALCGFGFLSLLNAVPGMFAAVKTIGAIYLAWLGLKLVRGAIAPARGEAAPVAMGAPFRQGFLTTILNPKVAVFFLAALPQFVGTGPEAPLRGVLLVGIVYAVGFAWLALLAGLASRAGTRIGNSQAMRWIEGALGTAFVGFAGKLALSRN